MNTSPKSELRRKRKWDEGPATAPTTGNASSGALEADPDTAAAAAAAAQAAAQLSRTLAGGAEAGGEHAREFEINDHPGRRFAMMSVNIRAVEQRSNVVIVSKGRYYAPGERRSSEPGDEHRPLFLKIRGKTAESISSAVRHLEEVMAPRAADPARPDRVWADMDASSTPAFDVVQRMRGPNGEYLRYIEVQSGARVEVAGRGAMLHARDNLHFAVRGDPASVAKARALCQSLCRTIRPVFEEYRKKYYGDVSPSKYGNGRPHGVRHLGATGGAPRPGIGYAGSPQPPGQAHGYGSQPPPPHVSGSTPEWMTRGRS